MDYLLDAQQNPKFIFVTGQASAGKTQWMLQQIGCQTGPDGFYDIWSYSNGLAKEIRLLQTNSIRGIAYLDSEADFPDKGLFKLFVITNAGKYDEFLRVLEKIQKWTISELYFTGISPRFLTNLQKAIDGGYLTYDADTGTHKALTIRYPPTCQKVFFESSRSAPQLIIAELGKPLVILPNFLESLRQAKVESWRKELAKLKRRLKPLEQVELKFNAVQTSEEQARNALRNLSSEEGPLRRKEEQILADLDALAQLNPLKEIDNFQSQYGEFARRHERELESLRAKYQETFAQGALNQRQLGEMRAKHRTLEQQKRRMEARLARMKEEQKEILHLISMYEFYLQNAGGPADGTRAEQP